MTSTTLSPAAELPPSPFQWLADRRFSIWLTRLFWLLLIVETFLWTSIGPLFAHGEVIAPVLFATSKATLLVGSAYLLVFADRQARATPPSYRLALGAAISALFLLWFAESLLHAVSVLLVWLYNFCAGMIDFPASNSWDMLDMALRETGAIWFDRPEIGYLTLSNLAYGLLAIVTLGWLTRLWPARRTDRAGDGGLSTLPHWSALLLTYVVVAVLHGLLMAIWVT